MARILDDPVEPGEKARRPVERVETAVDAQERLLDDLGSVLLVTDETERDRERAALVALDELLERGAIASLGTVNELTVVFRFRLAGQLV
jgi:hypothetical protein